MFVVKVNGEEKSQHTQLVDAYAQVDIFKLQYLQQGKEVPTIEITEIEQE